MARTLFVRGHSPRHFRRLDNVIGLFRGLTKSDKNWYFITSLSERFRIDENQREFFNFIKTICVHIDNRLYIQPSKFIAINLRAKKRKRARNYYRLIPLAPHNYDNYGYIPVLDYEVYSILRNWPQTLRVCYGDGAQGYLNLDHVVAIYKGSSSELPYTVLFKNNHVYHIKDWTESLYEDERIEYSGFTNIGSAWVRLEFVIGYGLTSDNKIRYIAVLHEQNTSKIILQEPMPLDDLLVSSMQLCGTRGKISSKAYYC